MKHIRNYLTLFFAFLAGTAMFASCSDEERKPCLLHLEPNLR